MSTTKPDEVKVEKRDGDYFVVSKTYTANNGTVSSFAHVAYTRTELEQLIVEARKLLEEVK